MSVRNGSTRKDMSGTPALFRLVIAASDANSTASQI